MLFWPISGPVSLSNMNPVRSCGSRKLHGGHIYKTMRRIITKADNESEEQAPLEARLLTGQASYLPAKARAGQVV